MWRNHRRTWWQRHWPVSDRWVKTAEGWGVIDCQSVVRCALEYSGCAVWVNDSAHHHASVGEIGSNVGCSLIAVGSYHNIDCCRHIAALYHIVVIHIAFTVNIQFLVDDIAFKGDATESVRGVHIGVVKGGLYRSRTIVY